MQRHGPAPIRWPLFGAALLLALLVLPAQRQTCWRPFEDTAEESTVSFHAYGFAAASTINLWPNPMVAPAALEGPARLPLPRHLPSLAAVTIAGLLAVRLAAVRRHYQPDAHIRLIRQDLMRIVEDPALAASLERCSAFKFQFQPGHHFLHEDQPGYRIGQFFFGRQVAERARRGAPVHRCPVSLADHTIRDLAEP